MAGTFQNSWRGAAAEADAIGEQQLTAIGEQQTKRTPSGSRVEADTIGGAVAEADAIGKQSKRTQSRAAAEADASGEKQLKRMQAGSSAPAETDQCNRAPGGEQQLKRTQSGSSKLSDTGLLT